MPQAYRDDGDVGIWDIQNHQRIVDRIENTIQDLGFNFTIEEVYAIGKYGAGTAVPGESQLNILVTGYFEDDVTTQNKLEIKSKIIDTLRNSNITSDFTEIPTTHVHVEEPEAFNSSKDIYQSFDFAEEYYSITNQEKL